MSVISISRKEAGGADIGGSQNDFMTTTDVARLCGVSRFTVINWAKRGKIKTIRTVGRHHRIEVSEVQALLRRLEEKEESSSPAPERHVRQQKPTVSDTKKRGNCLTGNEQEKRTSAKNKDILHRICYTVGRGAHILKGRREAK